MKQPPVWKQQMKDHPASNFPLALSPKYKPIVDVQYFKNKMSYT